jgi:hypothetical protein
MKLPIFVNVTPAASISNRVLLREGKWKVHSDAIDSVLVLELHDTTCKNVDSIDIPPWERAVLEVRIVGKGTEKAINVYAEKL